MTSKHFKEAVRLLCILLLTVAVAAAIFEIFKYIK